MTDITHELYISRDADNEVDDGDVLTLLNEFIGENAWQQTGCGAGFGTRDLDVRLNEPLTLRNVVDLQNRLRNRLDLEDLDVLYEEWGTDAENPLVAYTGDDPLEDETTH